MTSPPYKSPALIRQANEVRLSNHVLVLLLQDVLGKGLPFRFQVQGLSMTPFLRDGDVITISPRPRRSYRLGEVVAYVHPLSHNLIVHRIRGRKAEAFLIQGDNDPTGCDIVPGHQVLGYLSKLERSGREIRFGLGPERLLIVWLLRFRLALMLRFIYKILYPK